MTSTKYKHEFTLNAFLSLGGRQVILSATIKDSKEAGNKELILSASLGTLSLKQIIEDIIHLVRPTYNLVLPFPWDEILSIELQNVVLSYNPTQKSIGFATNLKFGVPALLDLQRVYIDAKSVHEVMIKFDGTVFGESYHEKGWNLVGADGPPTPPPNKDLLFQLNFLGLGQRLRLTNAPDYKHVSDAITDMESLFDRPAEGTLVPKFTESLVFDNNSNWLFGLDAEIMGTVDLAIVFNDPVLYGIFISLKGEKAKSLAGLQFEILYKKITDDIGVYQIELVLPAYIRNMEFGQVSVTLPQVGVDIYTNGNFKIDFGFPRNLDFSSSFAVQFFPFVGFGGFYFAVLNGATASRLPVSSNGSFNPVLEFGIGLQLGVGKVIDKGILQATAILTYIGVVEGSLAWFNLRKPDHDLVNLESFYYRLSGTFAIVGRISGTVNFAIISATLDMTVYAAVTVVIEACEPIELSFIAGVSVSLRVSIDCGIFTIHIRLSFRTSISYQFRIGHSGPSQWNPRHLLSPHSGDEANKNSPKLLHLDESETNQYIPLKWQHWFEIWGDGFNRDKPTSIDLYYITQFSAINTADEQHSAAIAMLFARYEESPEKKSSNGEKALSYDKNFAQLMPFEQIAMVAFCWALNAAQASPAKSIAELLGKAVTAKKLANILFTLENINDPALNSDGTRPINPDNGKVPFKHAQLSKLIQNLFILNIADPFKEPYRTELAGENTHPDLHLALFPMIPGLSLRMQHNPEIAFSTYNPVIDDYHEVVTELVKLLSIDLPPDEEKPANGSRSGHEPQSMATLLFCDYFLMIIKSLLQSARDTLEVFHYTIEAGDTLYKISKKLTVEDVDVEDIVAIGLSNANNHAILNEGGMMTVCGHRYAIKSYDTLAMILEKHSLLKGAGLISDMLTKQIIALNGDKNIFIAGKDIELGGLLYQIKENDTLNSIVKEFSLNESQVTSLFNNLKDIKGILQPGKSITVSQEDCTIDKDDTLATILIKYDQLKAAESVTGSVTKQLLVFNGDKQIFDAVKGLQINGTLYDLEKGDSLNSIVKKFSLNDQQLMLWLNNIKNEPAILLTDANIIIPAIHHSVEHADTVAKIAGKYNFKPHDTKSGDPVRLILALNGDIAIFSAGREIDANGSGLHYKLQEADTYNSILQNIKITSLVNSIKDKTGILQQGETITVIKTPHTIKNNDTLAGIVRKYNLESTDHIIKNLVRQLLEENGDRKVFSGIENLVARLLGEHGDSKVFAGGEKDIPAEGYSFNTIIKRFDIDTSQIGPLINAIKDRPDILITSSTLCVTVHYRINAYDTLALILEKFGQIEKGEQVNDKLAKKVVHLNNDNNIFIAVDDIELDGAPYTLTESDTLDSVLYRFNLNAEKSTLLVNGLKNIALKKFKQLLLPPIRHEINKDDTLLSVATQYRIELGDLLIENRHEKTLLSSDSEIIVENLPSQNIGELLWNLYRNDAFGHAAGTTSRFFMSGLRLPNKIVRNNENEGFNSLYHLTGQQFTFNHERDEESGQLRYNNVTLSKAPGEDEDPLPWVTFNGYTLDPETEARKLAELVHFFDDKENDDMEIKTAENYQRLLPRFLPNIELGPVSIKLYNDQLKTFTFSNPLLWQREAPPGESTENPQKSITPCIWRFPPGLRSIRYKSPNLCMVIGTQARKDVALQKEYLENDQYTWSTLLPITIRKIQQSDSGNKIYANTYDVYGTDAAGIELLTDLVKLVNLEQTIVESAQILFPSTPEMNEAKALQSYDETCMTLFINTNLSTESNPDTLTTSAIPNGSGIPNTTAEEMIKRLWKASLVRTGGFYLYINDSEGNGVPESLFSDDQLAEIFLLINYQKTDQIATYMNSVTIQRAIDTQQSVLFAEWIVPKDKDEKIISPDQCLEEGKIVRVPAILPGHAGFKIVRTNPRVRYCSNGKEPDPSKIFEYQFETQYNLLDFRIKTEGIFEDIGEGLAIGPEKDYCPHDGGQTTSDDQEDSLNEPWKYKRIFPLTKIIKQEYREPSRYIGLNKSFEMQFGWRDNYGNQINQADFTLDFTVKYFDYLIALSQWPHFNVNYEFIDATTNNPNFRINLLFQPGNEYVLKTDDTKTGDISARIKALKDKVKADLDVYQKALDQIQQADVRLSFTVSMTQDVNPYPQSENRANKLKSDICVQLQEISDSLEAVFEKLKEITKNIKDKKYDQEKLGKPRIPVVEESSYTWTEEIGNTNPEDIFPLEVMFSIVRDEELIDEAFEHVPQARAAKSPIKPRTEIKPLLSISDDVQECVDKLDTRKPPEKLLRELKRLDLEGLKDSEWENDKLIRITIKQQSEEWQLKIKGQSYAIRLEDQQINIYRAGAGYRVLAEVVERIYPGMKLCTAYTKGKQQQEVWVVRFKSDNTSEGIGYTINYDQAWFYAPQPLSTHLVTLEQVPLYEHTGYKQPPQQAMTYKTYNSIDPEIWAIDYLETMEAVLSPEFSIPISMFDNYQNNRDEKGFLRRILKAKHRVAEAIAYQTIPILEDVDKKIHNQQEPYIYIKGLGVAREKLKQQLLINLLDAYKTNAVVQYNANVACQYPDEKKELFKQAPNLFGQPYVVQSKALSTKHEDNNKVANYSLSTAKVALNGATEDKQTTSTSYLTFLFNTQTEHYRPEIPLEIDYRINHLEFDIRKLDDKVDQTDVDDIRNYSVSKWLSFVIPFSDSRNPPLTRVPIPIRVYPKPSNWDTQQFIAYEHSKKVVRSIENAEHVEQEVLSIEKAKQVDYEFSYVLPQFTAQDSIHVEVLFNSHKKDEMQLARGSMQTDDADNKLHECLAQFSEAKDPILSDLEELLPHVKFEMDEDKEQKLKNLLASYENLANMVADEWYKRFNPDNVKTHSGSKPKVITASFVLEEGIEEKAAKDGLQRFQVAMSKWNVKSGTDEIDYVAIPEVIVEGYEAEAHKYVEGNKVIFQYFKWDPSGEKDYLAFKVDEEIKPPLARTIKFKKLDVLLVQNAWPGQYVKRNANLSSDKHKQTLEEFVYKTAMSRLSNPLTPMLDVPNPLDIASLVSARPADLSVFLSALLNELLGARKAVKDAEKKEITPTTLKIITSYSYCSNPDVGTIITLPCFLIPPTKFDKSDAKGKGAGIKMLIRGITDWFDKNQPVLTDGRLHLDISFYSLLADNDLPVLRLRELYIDVKELNSVSGDIAYV